MESLGDQDLDNQFEQRSQKPSNLAGKVIDKNDYSENLMNPGRDVDIQHQGDMTHKKILVIVASSLICHSRVRRRLCIQGT
ncbi:hypothetical protein GJ496_006496 [Pomphorhynchus laevis]|nr:hypothetical protein GJ496_006496 [Pomphorhynchus laevis]